MSLGEKTRDYLAKLADKFKWKETPAREDQRQDEKIPTARMEAAPEQYALEAGAKSIEHKSERHPINEDTYIENPENGTYGVFDGMGGHAAGEVASKEAGAILQKELSSVSIEASAQEIAEKMQTAFEAAQETLHLLVKTNPEYERMATTASVVKFAEGGKKLVLGQVGDSRVYRLREGKLERISPEDSAIEIAIKYGFIKSDQDVNQTVNIDKVEERLKTAKNKKEQNELMMLLRVLGMTRNGIKEHYGFDTKEIPIKTFRNVAGNAIEGGEKRRRATPHILTFDVKEGDKYLLCSDGVSDNLTEKEIREILTKDENPRELAEELALKSKEIMAQEENPRAKHDDTTALVVEIKKAQEPLRLEQKKQITESTKRREQDLKNFRDALAVLNIDQIRNVFGDLQAETSRIQDALKNNPQNQELMSELTFTRQKMIAISEEIRSRQEIGTKTRALTQEELKKIKGGK